MSTNGIDNIVFGNPGVPGDDWLRTARPAREADAPADAALRADYADAIRKALQLQQAEQDAAVQAAMKAIEQDTLDTPENIQAAAENLLAFGI